MATTEGSVLRPAKSFTTWYIVAAILFILLGAFAIIEPAVAGLGVALLVGWLLVFGALPISSAHSMAAVRKVSSSMFWPASCSCWADCTSSPTR
ncbi:MAG TPA: hypothetical protein VKB72_01990 [Steroidobacteraceae bacterium]|nr:hypothetical protein [Steroidobacteraceae bacterium]